MLGYVGVDDTGLGGLEQKFEPQLHGVPGRMFTAMDARRRVLGSTEREPEPGKNLVLTIDSNIQFLAERALDHAMEQDPGGQWNGGGAGRAHRARFSRLRSGPRLIPISFGTPHPRCCAITR